MYYKVICYALRTLYTWYILCVMGLESVLLNTALTRVRTGNVSILIFGYSHSIEAMEQVTNVLKGFLSTQRMMVLCTMLSIMRKKILADSGSLLDLLIMVPMSTALH